MGFQVPWSASAGPCQRYRTRTPDPGAWNSSSVPTFISALIVAVNDRDTNVPMAVVNAVRTAQNREARLVIVRKQKRHTILMKWE